MDDEESAARLAGDAVELDEQVSDLWLVLVHVPRAGGQGVEDAESVPGALALEDRFRRRVGEAEVRQDGAVELSRIGKAAAEIDFASLQVNCPSRVLKDRVENIVKRGCRLSAPFAMPLKDV